MSNDKAAVPAWGSGLFYCVSRESPDSAGVFVRLKGSVPYRMTMPVQLGITAVGLLGGAYASDDLNQATGQNFDQVIWALVAATVLSAAYYYATGGY